MQATPSPRKCWRCAGSDSCPRRFLLTCHTCAKSWHHRCHVPVVSDSELISRFNSRSIDGWRCRRCTHTSANNVPPPMPIYIDLDSPPISIPSSPSAPDNASRPVIDLTAADNTTANLTALPDSHQATSNQFKQGKVMSVYLPCRTSSRSCEASKTEMQIPAVRRAMPDLVDSEWMRQALLRRSVRPPGGAVRKRAAAQQPSTTKLKCHRNVQNLVMSIRNIRL